MRCRGCQRAISGIGKPAVPPVIPALVALAGSIGGLWSLTLGQDPSNALPHWSPVSGWGLALGSLAVAAVLASISLKRRRCPDCGSSQMYDAMEEEAAIANERLAAQKAAVEEARTEWRSLHDKETADGIAAREAGLRSAIEQELRTRLVRELQPQVEHDLRERIEKELRVSLGNELRLQAEREQRSVAERSVPAVRAFTSPVTPGPVTPKLTTLPRTFTSPSPSAAMAGAHPPRATVQTTAAKDITPSPVRPFAAPQPKVETAPLALLSPDRPSDRPAPAKDRGGK
jgi:hypothetical protein